MSRGATSPREAAARIEETRSPPDVPGSEGFRGFGVIGVPFERGDVLAMRRFPASSVGPGYTSLWHRGPDGKWTFYQDQDPLVACPRAFGPAIDDAIMTEIALEWTAPDELVLDVERPVPIRWEIRLTSTAATSALSAIVSAVPSGVRRSAAFAAIAGRVAGPVLGAGRLRLTGEVPSGQHFHADMQEVWAVEETRAVIDGQDLGRPTPLPEQVRLGDFWIPQRGLFAFGDGLFDRYDPAHHLHIATRHEVAS